MESELGEERLYTAAQCRALDAAAIEGGLPGITLMARAAEATFNLLWELWPECRGVQVLCGTGNNGGDGYLVADLAYKRGLAVQVWQVGDAERLSGDAQRARAQALANAVPVAAYDGQVLAADAVVVDALLGTGLTGPARPATAQAIAAINACAAPTLAVDIPSGLCSDSGVVAGSAVHADVTISFIGLKRGLFTADAQDVTGRIHFTDLAVPGEVYSLVESECTRLTLPPLLNRLPDRPASCHKGGCGTVLVVGGDHGMAGAAALAAEAALRCGAGLVKVATREAHVAALVARRPEVMVSAVVSGQELEPLVASADVLVVGPGLGQSPWSEQLLRVAAASGKPMVLDADGLNLLSAGSLVEPAVRGNWILTPHPGEAARLLGVSTKEVQQERFHAAAGLQQHYGGVVVLKGNGTLISGGGQLLLSSYGNPGMASGGMGDVLSGVLGALLSQGLAPLTAAALGVCLHGAAADEAAQEGQRGLLASDLLPVMRRLLA